MRILLPDNFSYGYRAEEKSFCISSIPDSGCSSLIPWSHSLGDGVKGLEEATEPVSPGPNRKAHLALWARADSSQGWA